LGREETVLCFLPVVYLAVSINIPGIPAPCLFLQTGECAMFQRASQVIFVILFVLTPAYSQLRSPREPAEISGQLRYAAGGAPAAEVVVRVDQLSGGFFTEVRTDRLGKFRISGLSPIQYQVIIRHPGYVEISREVNLVFQSRDYLQLQLVAEASATPITKPVSPRVLDVNLPVEARHEFERGESLVNTGDKKKMAEGMRHFERAIAIHAGFIEAKLKLATTHMDLEEWTEAEQVLVAANKAHPQSAEFLFALGEVYLRQKKTEAAEKALRDGLQLEPRSWQGHFTLGRLYWQGNDIVKAARQVALALQLNPNFAEAHLLAGNIFLKARKNTEAQFEFQEYLRLSPSGQYAREAKEILEKIKKAGGNPTKN
jgi:Tfp pilus assembly protein PilF